MSAIVRLRSVVFQQSVRLPGSSSTNSFLDASDYQLTVVDVGGCAMIQAELKTGVQPVNANFGRVSWFPLSFARDVIPAEGSILPTVEHAEKDGKLVATPGQLRTMPDGTFERIVEGEGVSIPAPVDAPPAPAPKRTRGPNKPKAAPAAAPLRTPPAPVHPANRVGAGGAEGGA